MSLSVEYKYLLCCLLIFHTKLLLSCKTPKPPNALDAELSIVKINAKLQLKPRWVYVQGAREKVGEEKIERKSSQTISYKKDLKQITQLLAKLSKSISEQNPSLLLSLIHPEQGVYVDLKAHWSYKRLQKEIGITKRASKVMNKKPANYLSTAIYLGTKDGTSLYEVLQLTKQIEVDYYLQINPKSKKYSLQSCELKLHLTDEPDASYQLNNPVFLLLDNKWYLYRLF